MGISMAPKNAKPEWRRSLVVLFAAVWSDIIFVYAKSEEMHLDHPYIVFKRPDKYEVTLNG